MTGKNINLVSEGIALLMKSPTDYCLICILLLHLSFFPVRADSFAAMTIIFSQQTQLRTFLSLKKSAQIVFE